MSKCAAFHRLTTFRKIDFTYPRQKHQKADADVSFWQLKRLLCLRRRVQVILVIKMVQLR